MISQHILVPIDFSEPANQALEYAMQLARQLQAHLTLLHVIHIPPLGGTDVTAYMEHVETGAQEAMEECLQRVQHAGLPGQSLLVQGVPWQEIVDKATATQADLIVMSTHGRTGFQHLLLGSVAERVVRLAPCPVLVTRPSASAGGGTMAREEYPQQPLSAADIMTRNPVVVDSTATVQDVADVMVGAEARHIPVVEQGTLVGMVSDRDLRSYLLPRSEQIIRADDARARLEANVGLVMRTDMLTVTPETPVVAIIDLFLQEHIGAVPVLQPTSRALLGMVSYIDVLRAARAFF